MTDETLDIGDTDNTTQNNDQAEKTYTQEEFDAAMAGARRAAENKMQKKIEALGGLEHLTSVVESHNKREESEARRKGEYDKIIDKKNDLIATLSKEIEEFKVSNPLLNAAAKHRAISPEQVVALTKGNVKLTEAGDVTIIDAKGDPRLNDKGHLMSIDEYMQSFIQDNPHMAAPGKSSTESNSSHTDNTPSTDIDLSTLDMTNPEHREIYKKHRAKMGFLN